MSVYSLEGVSAVNESGSRRVTVLQGVDLRIEAGEFVGLVGPSGCGKSTLLNVLAGFLAPTAGRVSYQGRDLAGMTAAEVSAYRNRDIGIVHQFFNLLPDLDALHNVMVPALIMGRSRAEAARSAEALLERVGILGRSRHLPSELSGGEQQRVAIARSLVNDPLVILGDEPTGNLDAATTAEILDLLSGIHRERGGVMVLATHDTAVAERASRRLDMARLVA